MNRIKEIAVKAKVFIRVVSLLMFGVSFTTAQVATDKAEGAWRAASKARLSSLITWYSVGTNDFTGMTDDGYVTYNAARRGWFYDNIGMRFHTFSTWVFRIGI